MDETIQETQPVETEETPIPTPEPVETEESTGTIEVKEPEKTEESTSSVQSQEPEVKAPESSSLELLIARIDKSDEEVRILSTRLNAVYKETRRLLDLRSDMPEKERLMAFFEGV